MYNIYMYVCMYVSMYIRVGLTRVNPYVCVSCMGPLCGPPLRWWVLCGALPSV